MLAVRENIGLGGGCHWCTEAVFCALRGVDQVEQGFIKSRSPDDTFSEAVLLRFDPRQIPLMALIDVHLRTHASTSNHRLRNRYRSAIYVYNDTQSHNAKQALQSLQNDFSEPLITEVLPFATFKASDERYHQYYEKKAGNQFCTRFIDPKLEILRTRYRKYL